MLYDDLIQARQAEIFNEVQDIDAELLQLTARLEKLAALKERRIAEHNMLQNVKDRGLIANEHKSTRVDFETAIKRIFDKAGRPMAIGELINELETFGYIFSKYNTAYMRLKSLGVLESTGARGYYNLLR